VTVADADIHPKFSNLSIAKLMTAKCQAVSVSGQNPGLASDNPCTLAVIPHSLALPNKLDPGIHDYDSK